MTASTDRRLTTREAAEYLGCADATLDRWRSLNKGPRYLKLGAKVLYRVSDLDEFVQVVETSDSTTAGH